MLSELNMEPTMRTILSTLIAAALLSALLDQAPAQTWPSRPVKVVVPFAPGGSADTLGRIAAEHLSKAFNQQFFVENRAGGGGLVGAKIVATAEPDGYTFGVSSIASHVIAP